MYQMQFFFCLTDKPSLPPSFLSWNFSHKFHLHRLVQDDISSVISNVQNVAFFCKCQVTRFFFFMYNTFPVKISTASKIALFHETKLAVVSAVQLQPLNFTITERSIKNLGARFFFFCKGNAFDQNPLEQKYSTCFLVYFCTAFQFFF